MSKFQPPMRGRRMVLNDQTPPLKGPYFSEASSMIGGATVIVNELKALKSEMIEVANLKLQEIDDAIAKSDDHTEEAIAKLQETKDEILATLQKAIEEVNGYVSEIQKGDPGKDADEDKIVEAVLAKIPKEEEMMARFMAQVPKLDEGKLFKKFLKNIPENKASLKIIQEHFETDPMSVIEKIMALPEDKLSKFKLKSTNIDGLEQTMSAFRNQLGRGYLHGGGLSTVSHDATLTGDGTPASPLGVVAAALSPLTTKGDLYTFSTVNARLPIGTNDQVLIANSAATTGNSWSDVKTINGASLIGSGNIVIDATVTLADLSANSTTTPTSLYTMTSTIPVEFRRSGGGTALFIDEATGNIDIGASSTSSRALRITRSTNTSTSSAIPVVEIFNTTTGTVGTAEIRTITTNGTIDGRLIATGTSGYSSTVMNGIGGMAVGTVSAHAFQIFANNATAIHVSTGQLVGVGTATPGALLHAYTSNTGPGVASQQIRFSWGSGTSPNNQSIALQGDNTGPSAISHTDGAGNSTFNAIAVKQEFGGNGFIVGISPATTAGSARTFTTRMTIDPTGTTTFVGPSLTGSQTTSGFIYNQTVNTSGVIDGAFKIVITDTASNGTSKFFSVVGGAAGTTALFSVNPSGSGTFANQVTTGGQIVNGGSVYTVANTSLPLDLRNGSAATAMDVYRFNNLANATHTSGTYNNVSTTNLSFVPAGAGSGNFRAVNLVYTVNGTAGVQTGIATGLLIAATETTPNGLTHHVINATVGGSAVFTVGSNGTVLASNTITSTLGLTAGTSLTVGANSSMLFSGRTQFQSLVNGDLWITNAAGNNFNILKLGDTTSSFPALKRNLAGLSIRVGDDSGAGRWLQGQGADVASASTITLGNGNSFELTGTTSVTLITSTGWTEGSIITLIANESVTITHGTATSGSDITILLAGAANFAMTANDTLTLILSSTTAGGVAWREMCRTAI